jgi:hypothetical protein
MTISSIEREKRERREREEREKRERRESSRYILSHLRVEGLSSLFATDGCLYLVGQSTLGSYGVLAQILLPKSTNETSIVLTDWLEKNPTIIRVQGIEVCCWACAVDC